MNLRISLLGLGLLAGACFDPTAIDATDTDAGGSDAEGSGSGGVSPDDGSPGGTSAGQTSAADDDGSTEGSDGSSPATGSPTTGEPWETTGGIDTQGTGAAETDDGSGSESGSAEVGETSDSGPMASCEPFAPDGQTVALWHMDEGAGQTVEDASGNGRDLHLGPTTNVDVADPQWTAGRFDGGLAFTNAQQDYASRDAGGNAFAGNQLTVELWVRTSATSYAQVFTAGFINCFLAVQNNGNGFDFGIGDGSNWEILTVQPGAGLVNDGQWHYVAATYDGEAMRLYLDGTAIGEMPASTTLASPGDYKVGGRPANTFLEGDMDEVRLSDIARSPDEIANYAEGC